MFCHWFNFCGAVSGCGQWPCVGVDIGSNCSGRWLCGCVDMVSGNVLV